MKKAVLAVAALSLMSSVAYAEEVKPFGITFGTPVGELNLSDQHEDLSDRTATVIPPLPNELFETYTVDLSPDNRVCKISGYVFFDNPSETIGALLEAHDRLATRYQFFDMEQIGLQVKNHSEKVTYLAVEGLYAFMSDVPVPAPLAGVMLYAKKVGLAGDYYISVNYLHDGFEQCGGWDIVPIDESARYQGL